MEKKYSIPRPTVSRRRFLCSLDELHYVYFKMLRWYYSLNRIDKARPFAGRVVALLKENPELYDVPLGYCSLAIAMEINGRSEEAVNSWRNAIGTLIRILDGACSRSIVAPGVLINYGIDDLTDMQILLAINLINIGRDDEALDELNSAKRICAENGIVFDGGDVVAQAQKASRGKDRARSKKT